MKDWNVVVSVHEKGFVLACELLGELGRVARTPYYNVLVMRVGDPKAFLERIGEWVAKDPAILTYLSRAVPAAHAFTFQSPEEFEAKARDVALGFIPELAGKSFHVRLHRRGFKGRLSSGDEERFLDTVLTDALEAAGTPGTVSFDDPDAVILVETVSNRAGMSLWTREDLHRYPFLHVD